MFQRLTGTGTFDLLVKGLEASALRHQVISNNIANVNTPLFKRQIVSFESEMARVFDGKIDLIVPRTNDKHIPIDQISFREVSPEVITDKVHIMRNDKNNVDIDTEMTDLAKNSMTYQILATRLSALLGDLNDVITRGGRV
ncbi:flagellar basal body rod protein FlgB [bacterium]|nr:flagellar basal body rod protein FlgB [bacterium]